MWVKRGLRLNKKYYRNLAAIIITFFIFYLIFKYVDIHQVISIIRNANQPILGIVFLLTVLIPAIQAKRWLIILKVMGYDLCYSEGVRVVMATHPFASITPSKSSDFIKIYYVKDKIPPTKTAGSVLTEKALDISTLLVFCVIGSLFYPNPLTIIIIILLIFFIIYFIISYLELNLPISTEINQKFRNIFSSTKLLMTDKKSFFIALVYTISLWFIAIIQSALLLSSLRMEVPFLFIMANMPIAIFMGQIPITLGGMGTRDVSIIELFSNYGTPSELLAVGLLFTFFRYWVLSIIGIPFMQKSLIRH